MSRPEHIAPPELFYNEKEAAKYNSCSRIIKVQEQLAQRAIELLNLPAEKECLILDVGCGSGLSGVALEEAGHAWIGMDISKSMLAIAAERDSSGDVFEQDIGAGLPFRPGVFDGCISISAIQWLCYSDRKVDTPRKRLMRFFSSLYICLKRGSRAVLQLYPESSEQMQEISTCAMRSGFSGGLVVDYPNSAKAKKYYLCLFAGYDAAPALPTPLTDQPADAIMNMSRKAPARKLHRGKRQAINVKDWVSAKKERYRKQGKKIKSDSKYTGRRRPGKF
uniref:Methyltransferase WBSCR22 putative n=1 Tax=Albugo laibachii Nc14 TaxID=890382 RepID=F0VZS2_9STRA|nr:methyltransferase WBSCR22 putative [Albugo laibachii Nc14]|eukprot:CCA14293.1 methyltransferase WBSCR22 putative [Albugo laibachii Nc14]